MRLLAVSILVLAVALVGAAFVMTHRHHDRQACQSHGLYSSNCCHKQGLYGSC